MSKNSSKKGWLILIAFIIYVICVNVYEDKKSKSSQQSVPAPTEPTHVEVMPDNYVTNPNTGYRYHRDNIFAPTSTGQRVETSNRREITPDDAYDEGYDEGYDQGKEDGRKGRSHGYGYDDSNSYYNYYETKYVEGYEEGYDEGYSEGQSEYEDGQGDEDDE